MSLKILNTVYLGSAKPGTGGGGSTVDEHNLGWYEDDTALSAAHPTATPGDYAFVASTSTIWVWDDTNSEWVDSEVAGQVVSVNGKTGVVVLATSDLTNDSGFITSSDIPVLSVNGKTGAVSLDASDVYAIPQLSTIPTAGSTYEGMVVQFVGTTGTYTKGYFYTCNEQDTPGTYAWERIDVQPAGGSAPVTSVNSKTGDVVLDADDVGAQAKITVTTVSASTLTQEIADNTIYNAGELSALTITLPGTITADFTSQVNFDSGTTPTSLTAPNTIVWYGDDIDSGTSVFVPGASKRYVVMFFSDGTDVRGVVQAN